MPYITTKSTISSITTAKGCTAAAATAICLFITSFHCSRDDFWIIHCYTSFEKSWSIMAAVLRFLEGHRCHGWSHQGITGSSSECQTSSPCDWQIPSDKMEEVVDAWLSERSAASSSSLMSWVALTASPGHGMYTCFLNNYYYCWWRHPFMNTASSSAYSNFAENRKWTKRKAQQRQHIHIVWVPERCL